MQEPVVPLWGLSPNLSAPLAKHLIANRNNRNGLPRRFFFLFKN